MKYSSARFIALTGGTLDGWSISSERSIKLRSTKGLRDVTKRELRKNGRKEEIKVIHKMKKAKRTRENKNRANRGEKKKARKPIVLKKPNARSTTTRRL